MRGRAAEELLSLPVRIHGIPLGRPVEVIVDEREDRVLGFELLCGDGAHRFLPLAIAQFGADEIAIRSALALIDERNLDFYRRHGRRLSDLGYAEPWVGEDGRLHEALSAA